MVIRQRWERCEKITQPVEQLSDVQQAFNILAENVQGVTTIKGLREALINSANQISEVIPMDKDILEILLVVFGSTGFWALIQSFINKKLQSKENKGIEIENLCKGLLAVLHKELYELCDEVIEQSYVTQEQLENINYMRTPYFDLGGDGTLEHMLEIIDGFEVRKR
jgi:hypothetical protein